jgi:glycosyltransferase involved in cell wall biosynthesis
MVHDRVVVFNKITHEQLVEIHNCCDVAICTSIIETQHLGGLEAASSNLPLVVTDVGMYHNMSDGIWGHNTQIENFKSVLDSVITNKNNYSSREYFLSLGYDKHTCRQKWIDLVSEVTNEND